MFGMNVMAWDGGDLEKLEVLQNRVGRVALGAPKWTAAEAFRGDLGWSWFSERMIKAVLNYMVRIEQMENKSEMSAMHSPNQRTFFHSTAGSCTSEYVVQTCKELAVFYTNGSSEETDVTCIRSLHRITLWLQSNRPTSDVVMSVGGRGSPVMQTMSAAASRLHWHVVTAAVQCLQALIDHLALDPAAKTGSSSTAVTMAEILQTVTLLLQTHHPFANVGHSEAMYGLLCLAKHILNSCSSDSLLPHTFITACRPYMFYGLPAYRSASSSSAQHNAEQDLQDDAELLLSSSDHDHDNSVKSNFTNRNRRKRLRRKKKHPNRSPRPHSSPLASDFPITTFMSSDCFTSANSSIPNDHERSQTNERIPAISSPPSNGSLYSGKSSSNDCSHLSGSSNDRVSAPQPSMPTKGFKSSSSRNPFASFSPASRTMPPVLRPPDAGELNATLGFRCTRTSSPPAPGALLTPEAETKLLGTAGSWTRDSLNYKSACSDILQTKTPVDLSFCTLATGDARDGVDTMLKGKNDVHAVQASVKSSVMPSTGNTKPSREDKDGRISLNDNGDSVRTEGSVGAVTSMSLCDSTVGRLSSGSPDSGAAMINICRAPLTPTSTDGESASGSEWEEERGVWSTSRLTARVRQAALAALSALLTSLGAGGKLRLWPPLLCQAPSLLVCLLGERQSCVRFSALALIYLLLTDSRQQIANATLREDRAAYSSLSHQLGTSIKEMHRVLTQVLMSERTTDGVVRTLKAIELLVDNVTYARLPPGLLSCVAASVKPYVTHDEAVVRANALSVLVSVLVVKPSVAEVRLLLLRYAAPLGRPSRPPTEEGALLPLSDDTDQWDEETPDEESANEILDGGEACPEQFCAVEAGDDLSVTKQDCDVHASASTHRVVSPTAAKSSVGSNDLNIENQSSTSLSKLAKTTNKCSPAPDPPVNSRKMISEEVIYSTRGAASKQLAVSGGTAPLGYVPGGTEEKTKAGTEEKTTAGTEEKTTAGTKKKTTAGTEEKTTAGRQEGRHLSSRRSLLSWLVDVCVDALLPPSSARGVHVQVLLQSLRLLSACISEHFCLVYLRLSLIQRVISDYCSCVLMDGPPTPGDVSTDVSETGMVLKHVFPLLSALVAVLKKECDAALQTDCSAPPSTDVHNSNVQELSHQVKTHLKVSDRSSERVSSSQQLCEAPKLSKGLTEVHFTPSEWRRLTVNVWLWALQEPLRGLLQLACVDCPDLAAETPPGVVRWHRTLTTPSDAGDMARCQLVAAANVITHITTEVTESLPDPLMESLLRCVLWLVGHSQVEVSVWGVRVAGSIAGHPAVQRAPHAADLVTAAVGRGTTLLTVPADESEESSALDADASEARLFCGAVNKTRLMAMSALANLTASLKHYSPSDPEEELLPLSLVEKLLKVAIIACGDKSKVRPHGVRCLGNTIGWLRDVAYQDQQGNLSLRQKVTWWAVRPHLVQRVMATLLDCCSGGSNMKMRWNACHALGHLLRCPLPIDDSQKWRDPMVTLLCSLIGGFHNYKVRIQACGALCSLPSRALYTGHYARAWRALLAAANSSQNVVDYLEILHRDDLICQVVRGMWHLAALVTVDDCEVLGSALQEHEDSVRAVVRRAYVCLPPHRWDCHELARQHVFSLVQDLDALTDNQSETLNLLTQLLFEPPPPLMLSSDLLPDVGSCRGAVQLP
ncbi:protein of unknown function DUF4042 [Trinorchestia longiramus]|nr:protein of unknown function DUF4042 [Trinorchestia longiramus]